MHCCDRVSYFTKKSLCSASIQDKNKFYYDYSFLPSHIIANILVYLDQASFASASRVCRSWHFASFDPMAVRTLRAYVNNDQLHEIEMYDQIRPFRRLKMIKCSFRDNLSYMRFFEQLCSNIYEIELNNCTVSIEQIWLIMAYAPNLKIIRLIHLNLFILDQQFKPWTLDSTTIQTTLMNIDEFELVANQTFDISVIGRYILMYTKKVRVLKVSIQVEYLSAMCDICRVVNVINRWEGGNLRELHFDGDFRNLSYGGDFYRFLAMLRAPHLKKLHIGRFSGRFDSIVYQTYFHDDFAYFCRHFTNLDELKIDGVILQELKLLCKYMPNLRILKIRNGDIDNFNGIENLKLLEELAISQPVGQEDREIYNLFIKKLPNLKRLQLLDYPIDKKLLDALCDNFKGLTDLRIQGLPPKECGCIFTSLPNLKRVHLFYDWDLHQTVMDVTNQHEILVAENRLRIYESRISVKSIYRSKR